MLRRMKREEKSKIVSLSADERDTLKTYNTYSIKSEKVFYECECKPDVQY